MFPMKSEHKEFLKGFGYAVQGIVVAVKQERNLRFHLCAGGYALVLSCFYPFSASEYGLLFLTIGLVIALELVNSAVERAVDQPDVAHWHAAGAAKDMAAGAVLVASIAAIGVGCALFLKKEPLIQMVQWFWSHPLALIVGVVSLPLAHGFVFNSGKKG